MPEFIRRALFETDEECEDAMRNILVDVEFEPFRYFLDGFIDAVEWAEKDDEEDWEDVEWSPQAALLAVDDCLAFFRLAGNMIDPRYEEAGVDFLLTRNGHGAGFWDGDWRKYGTRLSRICKGFREFSPYLGDDGKIHAMGGQRHNEISTTK